MASRVTKRSHRPPSRRSKSRQSWPVVVQPAEEGGYWASCPSIPGCYSQGKTIEETLTNIREAIELCLEDLSATERKHVSHEGSLHVVTV